MRYVQRVFEAFGLGVTDSTHIRSLPMETTCLNWGIGSLSSGSFIVCSSHPKLSTNRKTRATPENDHQSFKGGPRFTCNRIEARNSIPSLVGRLRHGGKRSA